MRSPLRRLKYIHRKSGITGYSYKFKSFAEISVKNSGI